MNELIHCVYTLCEYLYLCMCMFVHLHAYKYEYMDDRVCMWVYVCVNECICVSGEWGIVSGSPTYHTVL